MICVTIRVYLDIYNSNIILIDQSNIAFVIAKSVIFRNYQYWEKSSGHTIKLSQASLLYSRRKQRKPGRRVRTRHSRVFTGELWIALVSASRLTAQAVEISNGERSASTTRSVWNYLKNQLRHRSFRTMFWPHRIRRALQKSEFNMKSEC